jgi:hypothetical protein
MIQIGATEVLGPKSCVCQWSQLKADMPGTSASVGEGRHPGTLRVTG